MVKIFVISFWFYHISPLYLFWVNFRTNTKIIDFLRKLCTYRYLTCNMWVWPSHILGIVISTLAVSLWELYFLLTTLFFYISNCIPFPVNLSPLSSMRVLLHPRTPFCFSALAFPYTESLRLHRTKGVPSHRFQIR